MIAMMASLHISEADLIKEIRSILQQVESGLEIIVERDARPLAIIRPAQLQGRRLSECLSLMPEDSQATIDPNFTRDVEAAIAAHREPLEPPDWD